MKNFNNLTTAQCVSMSLAMMLLLFTIDLIIPLGVAFGVLYALPVLITFTTKRKKITILFAVLATILTLIGYYNSPNGGEEWKVIFNRSISIFLIWSVALSVLYYFTLDENATELNGRLTKNNLQLNNLKSILYETNTLAKVGSWELDIEKTIFFWSDTIKEILEEPLSYKPDWNTAIKYFEKGEPAKTIYDITKKAIIEGTSFNVSAQAFTAKGKLIWIRVIGKTEFKGGKCVRLYGSLQDITDKKHSEDKLKLSLEENNDIKTALNRSAILAYTDEKGIITYVNDKFMEISQYSKEELIGADHRIINSGHHSKEWMKDIWTTIKSGKIWQGDFKNKAKDGSFYWVKSTIVPSFDENGKITQYITIRYDITDRKKAEEAVKKQQEELVNKNNTLKRKEADLSAMIQNTSDVFWTLDRENKLILYNKAFEKLHLSVNDKVPIIGEPLCVGMLLKESINKCKEIHERSLKGIPTTITRPIHFLNTTKLYFEFTVNPLKDEKGNVVGSVISGRDINEIYAAKLEAEAATVVKSRFVSTVSHELRTPLNAIIGMSNHLEKFNTQENLSEDITVLKIASDNLLALITDILDFSKLESNKARITKTKFVLKEYIEEVADLYTPLITGKNLSLILEVSKDLPQNVLFDKSKLNQILSNLFSNAIKFTNTGSITFKVRQLDINKGTSKLELTVKDTGIGIPKKEISSVFESFNQSSFSSQSFIGGTGLGLTITKKLVDLLKGTINVNSEPRIGTSFSVILDFEIGNEETKPIKKNTNLNKGDLAGLEVLVAEDNEINAKIITRLLGQWNATVDLAENGKIAVEFAKNRTYDIILMDLQMPIKNGFEATNEIRLLSNNKSTKIIALTAQLDFSFDAAYSEGMFDGHILKPFQPDDLKNYILDYTTRQLLV